MPSLYLKGSKMDYAKDILKRLIEIYERREAFCKDVSSLRAIQLELVKIYPSYGDRYNHETYKDINDTIEKLKQQEFIIAEKNNSGQYIKLRLNVEKVSDIYQKLHKKEIPEQCKELEKVFVIYENCEFPILQKLLSDWKERIREYRKLPYDLRYDYKRVAEILRVLEAIGNLQKENYIRNFSTALFKDSKRFQREFRSTIESILYDYTEEVVEKNQILEYYNLYENPSYVMIKGKIIIHFTSFFIDVEELADGIALSNTSLEKIEKIELKTSKVITVENLTTYHDSDERDAVHIYLAGYHSHSKQLLLEKIYKNHKTASYYHKGDLDVYGFLILENLKAKTKIPFRPLMMDLESLKCFYQAGLYKSLTAADIKLIKKKIDHQLLAYRDVLQFMLEYNCKVEQESFKAVELINNR